MFVTYCGATVERTVPETVIVPLYRVSFVMLGRRIGENSHVGSGGISLVHGCVNGALKMVSRPRSTSNGYAYVVPVLVTVWVAVPAKVVAGPPHPVQPPGQALSSLP